LVYQEEAKPKDGRFFWKIKTKRKNNSPAAGIYIFIISDKYGNKKTGKIAIIR